MPVPACPKCRSNRWTVDQHYRVKCSLCGDTSRRLTNPAEPAKRRDGLFKYLG